MALGTKGKHAFIPPDKERFIAELEFVQCLATPSYIHRAFPAKCDAFNAHSCFLAPLWPAYLISDLPCCRMSPDLAQRRYFDNPAFTNFLVYLRYWKEPEYARHLRYPQCLAFLDVLTEGTDASAKFIGEMAKPGYQDFVHKQVFHAWEFSGAARLRELREAPTAAELKRAAKVPRVAAEGALEEAEPSAWGDGPSRFTEARFPLGVRGAGGV